MKGGKYCQSVVGRVLKQVGCKKFATTPRLGFSEIDHRFCPTSFDVWPLIRLCASRNRAAN